jgi:hypothetical protein
MKGEGEMQTKPQMLLVLLMNSLKVQLKVQIYLKKNVMNMISGFLNIMCKQVSVLKTPYM